MAEFEGKVAIVTGAASRIGRATAIAYGREGARVLASDLDEGGAAQTVGMIRETGGEAEAVRTNVADPENCRSLVVHATDRFGRRQRVPGLRRGAPPAGPPRSAVLSWFQSARPPTAESHVKIGELAHLAGVNIQTVRYYERRHLLQEPDRTPSGYREYDHHDLLRFRFILRAKELGFTLTEIDELLALRVDPRRTADDVRARAEEKIASTDRKIRDLKRIRAALQHLVGSCEAHGPVSQCALIHAIEKLEEAEVAAPSPA